MNLPNINNKMKNIDKQFKNNDIKGIGTEAFGLGIQVFKIQSNKIIDTNFKGKNRNMIKNIENPNQTYSYKQPSLPKPKILPSLDKSNSTLTSKQKSGGFLSMKNTDALMSDYSEKISQKKNTIVLESTKTSLTPGSHSIRRKSAFSTQKNLTNLASHSNSNSKSKINNNAYSAIKLGKTQLKQIKQAKPLPSYLKPTPKIPQTVLTQIFKPQTCPYIDYHSFNDPVTQLVFDSQAAQKILSKQIRQLKKLKQNEYTIQLRDRLQYLQSRQALIDLIMDQQAKQHYIQKQRQQCEKGGKKFNISCVTVPVTGFEHYQQQTDIQQYKSGQNWSGQFEIYNYENIDLSQQQE